MPPPNPPRPPALHPHWMVTMLFCPMQFFFLFFLHDFTITASWNWHKLTKKGNPQTKKRNVSLKTDERFFLEEHFHRRENTAISHRKMEKEKTEQDFTKRLKREIFFFSLMPRQRTQTLDLTASTFVCRAHRRPAEISTFQKSSGSQLPHSCAPHFFACVHVMQMRFRTSCLPAGRTRTGA